MATSELNLHSAWLTHLYSLDLKQAFTDEYSCLPCPHGGIDLEASLPTGLFLAHADNKKPAHGG